MKSTVRPQELFGLVTPGAEIINGARRLEHRQGMPLLGGFCEGPCSIEVLVEVRDQIQRTSRIGAWKEKKTRGNRDEAFRTAYDKAMAHAIIQLLPAQTWRPWIGAAAYVTTRYQPVVAAHITIPISRVGQSPALARPLSAPIGTKQP